jgi:L-fuconolactonase
MATQSTESTTPVVDSHVHYWDPRTLPYPWLAACPPLQRAFGPSDYRAANAAVPVESIVFVEANPHPDRNLDEVAAVSELARGEPRLAAIIAFVDLTNRSRRDAVLESLAAEPLVRGVRHNIQGSAAGFCLAASYIDGVREVGRRGMTFDLCVTHDQLDDVLELVTRAPDTRFVLDHCGKPPVRTGLLDPWRDRIERLAAFENVWCKLSGLLTEADPERWTDDDLLPYAEHVLERFGTRRVMYGSDWPVVTLASRSAGWYPFTRRLTAGWSDAESTRFYRGNATDFYSL